MYFILNVCYIPFIPLSSKSSTFFQIFRGRNGRNEFLPLSSTRPEESHFFRKKLNPGNSIIIDKNYTFLNAVAYLGFYFGGGGGSKFFGKKATRLLGGFGGMHPEKILKNGAIWCVLESILLKIVKKNNLKNSHFLYKNNR